LESEERGKDEEGLTRGVLKKKHEKKKTSIEKKDLQDRSRHKRPTQGQKEKKVRFLETPQLIVGGNSVLRRVGLKM